ncbi:hypothetical protein ACEWY4_013867 [Coilia grayii]|uniref:Uncharacterized protein n=1 Tax=Coilia grayii TaxID=363190 RepID=A0ABD1JXL5_9TELE
MVMSLRHLFRSKTLIRMLHRFGHCESYDFSLELETALAEAVESSSSQLSNQIIRYPMPPSVFHSEFDNLDKFINDVTGRESIHTAHGIMLQEVISHPGQHQEGEELQTIPRTKRRSFNLAKETTLPECYVSQKQNPKLKITQLTHPGGPEAMAKSIRMTLLWTLLHSFQSSQGKPITAWSGFISSTHNPPKKLTTIDYHPLINHPITEYSTIQECLRAAEEATNEVGQEYVITTFDMGVCIKALPLIWQNPERYKKHVMLPGTFHLECAFMKMLGKKMKGSGFEDILLEAGLISGGSLAGVMQGKNYDRAIHCHKIMLEALELLLFEEFTQHQSHPFSSLTEESCKKIDSLSNDPSPSALSEAVSDPAIMDIVDNYIKFRQTDIGATAKLWLYMYHVHLLLALITSVKTNNYLLYVQAIQEMCPIFFSFGGQNYARYMTYFSAFFANIDYSHAGASDLIRLGTFSVARSFISGNRCATDKTMEETFMRHAKSHGGTGEGLSGILTNYKAYQRRVRTTHLRSLYVDAALNMADMGNEGSDGNQHRDLRPTEIQRSDKEVKKTKDAIKSFLNPFSSSLLSSPLERLHQKT